VINTIKKHTVSLFLLLLAIPAISFAQQQKIRGEVSDRAGDPVPGVMVYVSEATDSSNADTSLQASEYKKATKTNTEGQFTLIGLSEDRYELTFYFPGMKIVRRRVTLGDSDQFVKVTLEELEGELDALYVAGKQAASSGLTRMNSVEGVTISEAKKNAVLMPSNMTVNLAANKARQIYAKVPGINVWQNTDAGVQTNIGARGLNPSRSSHFNMRQNGYDIAADALGYPESYYTPPSRAIKRIEIIRGAGALQYGTQFGGMVNYVFKNGPRNEKLEFQSNQSAGSYGLLSSYNSVGGTVGDFSYYGFYQYRTSDGWRPYSGMDQHTTYGSVTWHPSSDLSVTTEYTYMHYLAQQPGGLTDRQFRRDPTQSNRARNWFQVDWNLFSLKADYEFTSRTELNTRFFGLKAGRDAVGNLQRIDRMDFGGERSLLKDDYKNWGNETRFLHRYALGDRLSYAVVGTRYYHGFTHRRQGHASTGSDPDFTYEDPTNLHGSDYDLPSLNRSAFVENVFNITSKFSVTAGLRFEHILTKADGYYRRIVKDLAGNVLVDSTIVENRRRERSFVFYGVGASYKMSPTIELYGNYAQNYRAVNFNDIRVTVDNLKVDPNIEDERGFNTSLGIRGQRDAVFNYDLSLFYLSYQDRIGTVLETEPDPRFNGLVDHTFRYRTNVADARIYGLESFFEFDIWKYLRGQSVDTRLSLYSSLALMQSEYVNAEVSGIQGNAVEHVPNINWKSGLTFSSGDLQVSYQFTYLGEHYSDATNARSTPTAVAGIIPAYHVMDLSAEYGWRRFSLETGVNNLTNHRYFTRRATGYPGPGIIPAKPRNIYLSIGIEL